MITGQGRAKDVDVPGICSSACSAPVCKLVAEDRPRSYRRLTVILQLSLFGPSLRACCRKQTPELQALDCHFAIQHLLAMHQVHRQAALAEHEMCKLQRPAMACSVTIYSTDPALRKILLRTERLLLHSLLVHSLVCKGGTHRKGGTYRNV